MQAGLNLQCLLYGKLTANEIIQWLISIHTTNHSMKVSIFFISKGGPKRWMEVFATILRGRLPVLNVYVSQYFLLKAQTKSLLVVGDHKFQVMIVTNKKYILQGSRSTKACY